jgi:hypothetical protein
MPKLQDASRTPIVAVFCIHVHDGACPSACPYEIAEVVSLYAIHRHSWPARMTSVTYVGDGVDVSFYLGSQLAYTQLLPPVGQPSDSICHGVPVGADCVLGQCIQTELVAALQRVHGTARRVKVKCWRCYDYFADVSRQTGFLWAVSW